MHHRDRQETENTFLFHNFDLILDHLCEINFIGLCCQFPFKKPPDFTHTSKSSVLHTMSVFSLTHKQAW